VKSGPGSASLADPSPDATQPTAGPVPGSAQPAAAQPAPPPAQLTIESEGKTSRRRKDKLVQPTIH